MDRTMIAPWKAEEKELSEKLYSKLKGVSLLYPMNEELRRCLAGDMFLKPNQTAFFQVMSYLFRLLDPVEFKRRFFWPITDKKSEANFRSSTVEYLKHLNEKHNLQWSNISYLAVMPGGMKFITFLLGLINFIIDELIKQREKQLGFAKESKSFKQSNAKAMARENAMYKENTSRYIEELEIHTNMIRGHTQGLMKIVADVCSGAGIEMKKYLSKSFLEAYEKTNRQILQLKLLKPLLCVQVQDPKLRQLKEYIDQFQTQQTMQQQSNDAIDNTLQGIQCLYSSTIDNGSKGNALLTAFNKTSNTMAEQLNVKNHCESNDFNAQKLDSLLNEIAQVESQLNNVQKNLNVPQEPLQLPSTPMRKIDLLGGLGQSHSTKYISTPPIKLEFGKSASLRLPLQDDFYAKQFQSFNESLLAVPQSARKAKLLEQSTNLDTSMNRSKIVDASQLLRTIKSSKKVAHSKENLGTLGAKWKTLQASFGFDGNETSTLPTSPKVTAAVTIPSPRTPFNSNDCTRLECLAEPAAVDTTIAVDNNTNNANSFTYGKKSAAMIKVLDASLNDISTSPSGRLESLGGGKPVQGQKSMLPRLKLNDVTIDKENERQEDEDLNICDISDTVIKDISM